VHQNLTIKVHINSTYFVYRTIKHTDLKRPNFLKLTKPKNAYKKVREPNTASI
jgi:hypothetical protein